MGKSKEQKIKKSSEEGRSEECSVTMAKSKEKKRRSKEAEIGETTETINVEIKAIGEIPEKKTSPIIGYFPSGFDPLKISDTENGSGASVKVYKNVNSRNPRNPRMQVVVGVNGSAVNFVGTNYSGEATAPQLCNYALGVLDKETGVLKVVPIAANRIFRLEPKVGGLEQPENELPDAAEEDTAAQKADKIKTFREMYATKKSIRQDRKLETLRETGDPGKLEDLDQKLEGIEVKKGALDAVASTADARGIPPYDLEATVAELAYPLDKIILRGEWDYLLDIYELTQSGSEVTPDIYPSFVCNRIHKLEAVEDESKKKRMAGILSYITHLIKFKDIQCMDGIKSAKHHKLPSILSQKFSSMFGSKKDKRVPEDKKQLLISYVLVLSLFADDFRSDLSDIAKDLRISQVQLRTHYEYLGCKLVRDNKVLTATLPVPLEFQTIKRKRRREGR